MSTKQSQVSTTSMLKLIWMRYSSMAEMVTMTWRGPRIQRQDSPMSRLKKNLMNLISRYRSMDLRANLSSFLKIVPILTSLIIFQRINQSMTLIHTLQMEQKNLKIFVKMKLEITTATLSIECSTMGTKSLQQTFLVKWCCTTWLILLSFLLIDTCSQHSTSILSPNQFW